MPGTAHAGPLLQRSPGTVWITGLSGAGKTTLSRALQQRMNAAGLAVLLLDGDDVRAGLNRDLGFSSADRTENIRRVAEVASLANRSGIWVVAAFISPLRIQRQLARDLIGSEHFIEVFLDTALDVCARRDAKGLYAQAKAGQIGQFTGLSAPYEPPLAPALAIDTAQLTPAQAVAMIWQQLAAHQPAG
ncbi:putative adenylyl-sulfate kinase [Andreprevotia sp. IGB-42]|nr:putative adenylyl-sulfate kinase [Andreprevotia sp. IGB-42]